MLSRCPNPHDTEQYLLHLFSSKAARDGAVIRRRSADIERFLGRERFLDEVARRGFTALENAGQIIVFCNAEPVRRIDRNRYTETVQFPPRLPSGKRPLTPRRDKSCLYSPPAPH